MRISLPYGIHVNFDVDRLTITMLPLGPHVYRSEDNRQMIICGDIKNPITVRESDMAKTDVKKDFSCKMAFQYYHPGRREASLRIGRDEKYNQKVSWNHAAEPGKWKICYLEPSNKVHALNVRHAVGALLQDGTPNFYVEENLELVAGRSITLVLETHV